MGHTITEKILSAHSGTKDVSPGDIVMADLDLVVDLDIVFDALHRYLLDDVICLSLGILLCHRRQPL